MKFQIPRQHKPSRDRIDVKLEQSLLQKLDLYCQYMESDRDYVVGTVLQIVFKRDKGFSEWLRLREAMAPAGCAADRTSQRPSA